MQINKVLSGKCFNSSGVLEGEKYVKRILG